MQTPTSLVEILDPPMNPWLKALFRQKNSLPEGVRVVRFNGEEGDEADDLPTQKKAQIRAAEWLSQSPDGSHSPVKPNLSPP